MAPIAAKDRWAESKESATVLQALPSREGMRRGKESKIAKRNHGSHDAKVSSRLTHPFHGTAAAR
jgi:hypothetical protein